MKQENILESLLSSLKSGLIHTHTFVGVYINKKGKLKVLKDKTGKFIWFGSCALIHNEFMSKLSADDPEFKNCDFYAISGSNYIQHRLMFHGYEAADVCVTPEMMLVLRAVVLEFHRKANLGLFLPILVYLNKLYAQIQDDPSSFFTSISKAKQLVMEETETCCSCGTLCHVPDITKHGKLTNDQMRGILDLVEKDKLFCFDCGVKFIIGTAKYKTVCLSDTAKAHDVQQLIKKCDSIDITQPNFDYEAAQNILKELMSFVSSSKMTVVDGDKVKSVKILNNTTPPSAPITQTPPWMS
jgi:hypothetical protein